MNAISAMAANDVGESEFGFGLLLSPAQFASECWNTKQRPSYQAWAVGIQLPDDVVRRMESGLVPKGTGIGIFSSSLGALYPVIVFQVGAMQVRVMLSLADVRTREWLKEVLTAGHTHLAIEVPETGQLAVATVSWASFELSEIDNYLKSCIRLNGEQKTLDAVVLARKLTQPGAMRSLIPGFVVQSVRLNVVLPNGERPVETTELAEQEKILH